MKQGDVHNLHYFEQKGKRKGGEHIKGDINGILCGQGLHRNFVII